MSITLRSDALTTLAEVKRLLRITVDTHDDSLTELINAATDRIERLTNRLFAAEDFREYYSGSHENTIIVKNRPIIYIYRLAYGAGDALEVQYTGSAIRATVQVTDDSIWLYSVVAAGTETKTQIAFGTYPSVSTSVTQINTISDWTATTKNDGPSYELHRTGGRDAKTAAIRLTYPDTDDNVYRVNYDAGLIEFYSDSDIQWTGSGRIRVPSGFQNVLVYYRGGYATIPDDIANIAADSVARAFQETAHDRSIQSESIGDYSVSTGGASDMIQFNEMELTRLRRWTNIPVGSQVTA